MNKKTQTVQTYNNNAKSFADKFDSLGARIPDIEETFGLVDKENPKVLEIGCGNGRDAEKIYKWTNDYLGIDISEELISLAKQKVSNGKFEVADVEKYHFPDKLDVVFAFASLIHTPKESLQEIFLKVFAALNEGGVFRLSMKYADKYEEITKDDNFGPRTYYLYSQNDIKELANGFSIIKNDLVDLSGQKWLEVLVQKSIIKNL